MRNSQEKQSGNIGLHWVKGPHDKILNIHSTQVKYIVKSVCFETLIVSKTYGLPFLYFDCCFSFGLKILKLVFR